MKFPFIKLEYYTKHRNPIWVDIRIIAQVYKNKEGVTKICTTAEDSDFPVWDSIDSIISRIHDFYSDGSVEYEKSAPAKKQSTFF